MITRNETYDVYNIPVADILVDDDFNCRGQFTVQSVQELSESISKHGLQFPVVVQPIAEAQLGKPVPHKWRLLAGHRRFKAITLYLRWAELPAMIRRGLSVHDARILNLTENLERKDLNPLEEAIAISRLYPHGVTVARAAAELKRDSGWVHARLRLMRMPEPVQQLVAARRIALLDLQIIARKTTPEEQIKAAEALAAAKRGRGRTAVFVGEPLTRSFRRRRNKSEVAAMIRELFDAGITGLPTRVAAWCAGSVTDNELREDIRRYAQPV
jgi:ParB/RepB/Spo0J family partition protein